MIERLAVALCTAVFAALTLLAWSFIAMALLGTARDDFGVMRFVTDQVFSEAGLWIVAGAAMLGFAIGAERMVAIFSLLWGTHSVWSRFNAWLHEKSDALRDSYEVSPIIAVGVIALVGAAAWLWLAP